MGIKHPLSTELAMHMSEGWGGETTPLGADIPGPKK
jgi:hypothetical protein